MRLLLYVRQELVESARRNRLHVKLAKYIVDSEL